MSRRSWILLFDTSLFGAVAVLLSPHVSGLPVHEWLGIAFGVSLLFHLLLSWTWIAGATARLWRSRDWRTRINYLLNALLFVFAVLEVVSGLVISQSALPSFQVHTINDASWRALHNLTSNGIVAAVGLHVAMNWRWITKAARRLVLAESER